MGVGVKSRGIVVQVISSGRHIILPIPFHPIAIHN